MSYAVLLVPGFPLHALLRSEAGLAGRPVALVGGEGRHALVLHASPEALGVEPGLASALALSRCPGIVLRTRDPAAEVEAQRLLIASAFTLSPRVESTAPGCCTADLQGASPTATEATLRLRLLELAAASLPARAAIGPSPLVALYAARDAAPLRVVDDASAFLAPLPLSAADPTPDQARLLATWGVHTLGGLTALPKGGIGQRLGPEGAALWDRAAGRDERVLRLIEPARTFAAEWDYEPPVEALDPLLFLLRRHAERIALELRATGFAAESLALTLKLEDDTELRRDFRLPEPNTDPDAWLRALHTHLETLRTAARVAGLRLAAAPARPPRKQDGLFDTGLRDPAAFWDTLARLGALVGDERVGTPAPVDTYRPDTYTLGRPAESVPPPESPPLHPRRGAVLRRFRPPVPARLLFSEGRPVLLESTRAAGAVHAARGPWRSAGAWWTPEPWALETWHVELETGGIYQLSRSSSGWCMEGVLD